MLHGIFARRTAFSSGKGEMNVAGCHVSEFKKPGSRARGPGALLFTLAIALAGALGGSRALGDFGVIDFRQLANEDFAADNTAPVVWINSILQMNNSIYFEGMSVQQRILFTGITNKGSDKSYTLNFRHQAIKASVHAYDFLTSWKNAKDAAAKFDPAPPGPPNLLPSDPKSDAQACADAIGPPMSLQQTCKDLHLGPNSCTFNLPDNMGSILGDNVAARVTAYELVANLGPRIGIMYANNPIKSCSMTFNGYVANDATYSLTFTTTSATPVTEILVEVAGHLAVGEDNQTGVGIGYGAGKGSSSISGGPYHFKLDNFDTNEIGNQDNQIKGADILKPPPPKCDCNTKVCPASTNQCKFFECDPTLDQDLNNPIGSCCVEKNKAGSTPCTPVPDTFGLCDTHHCDGAGVCALNPAVPPVTCPGGTGDAGCECGKVCDPATGLCVVAAGTCAAFGKQCILNANHCLGEHCDGAGNCVLFPTKDHVCQPPGLCEAGSNCLPATGLCVAKTDPGKETVCVTDTDACTNQACDTLGHCVLNSNKTCPGPYLQCDKGQVCNSVTGACDDVLPDPDSSTVCDKDGNACTNQHCDPSVAFTSPYVGQGACVLSAGTKCIPVISALPGKSTIECPLTPVFVTPTATAACNLSPSLTSVDVTTPGACPQEYTTTRTWTATNACGSSTASQTINVVDTTPPVITCPADCTLDCSVAICGILPSCDHESCPASCTDAGCECFEEATCVDACSTTCSVSVTCVPLPGACGSGSVAGITPPPKLQRTFTGTAGVATTAGAACGLTASCTQTITCACCGDNDVNQTSEVCDGTDDDACPGECQSDCLCPPVKIPTVSAWGMAALILVPLAGIAVNRVRKIRRERAA